MKKIVCFVIPIFFMGCITSNNDNNMVASEDTPHVIKLNIRYVDILIETPISIECHDFDKVFSDIEIKDTTITNQNYLNKFQEELGKFIIDSLGRKPDVRVKAILFFSNGSIGNLCFEGQNGAIEYNGKVVNYNNELANMINGVLR